MMRTPIVYVVLAIALLIACDGLVAQTQQGHIVIQVTDPTGAVIPQARVRLRPQPDVVPKKLETDINGSVALAVPPGDYALFAAASGFAPSAKRIEVREGRTETINIALHVATYSGPMVEPEPVGPESIKYVNPGRVHKQTQPVAVTLEVTDQTGAAVPYAQVFIAGTGTPQGLEIDERGQTEIQLGDGQIRHIHLLPFIRDMAQDHRHRYATDIRPCRPHRDACAVVWGHLRGIAFELANPGRRGNGKRK